MPESSASSGLVGMLGGQGKYCCVPKCGSARFDRFPNKTHKGLFKFPSKDEKPQKYQSLAKAISIYQRRGGRDTFHPPITVICEHHFKEEHLKKAAGSTRKTYREDAVPLIFKFKSLTRPN